jgi:hypothetical protein
LLVGMLRIQWPTWIGFTGRHAPDSLVDMDRITHVLDKQPLIDCNSAKMPVWASFVGLFSWLTQLY